MCRVVAQMIGSILVSPADITLVVPLTVSRTTSFQGGCEQMATELAVMETQTNSAGTFLVKSQQTAGDSLQEEDGSSNGGSPLAAGSPANIAELEKGDKLVASPASMAARAGGRELAAGKDSTGGCSAPEGPKPEATTQTLERGGESASVCVCVCPR